MRGAKWKPALTRAAPGPPDSGSLLRRADLAAIIGHGWIIPAELVSNYPDISDPDIPAATVTEELGVGVVGEGTLTFQHHPCFLAGCDKEMQTTCGGGGFCVRIQWHYLNGNDFQISEIDMG